MCRFRYLLEEHDLGRRRFDEVQRHLAAKGLKIATGTIVDATIINAPSSTKNAAKARDPEMHQTKKGNQWYFGMKAHLGVDSRTKLIRAVVATPANVADGRVLPELLHGKETRVWGDQAYRGQRAAIRQKAPRAQDFTNRRCRHRGVANPVGARQEPQQIEGAGQSRAFDRSYQARVRLRQGALPRAQEERASPDRDLRLGQSLYSTPATIAIRRGVISLICGKHPRQAPKPNQTLHSHCGLASSATPHQCHASLPRDQPLFRRSLTRLRGLVGGDGDFRAVG